MDRNIELIRYRQFGDELLLLELVNATTYGPAMSVTRQQMGVFLARLYQAMGGECVGVGQGAFWHQRNSRITDAGLRGRADAGFGFAWPA